jgi:eukaryotic-like serine/threonine-protein kinase
VPRSVLLKADLHDRSSRRAAQSDNRHHLGLTPGTRLGSYEIVAPLGAGGMGEVYRARDTRLERDVAIKVLPSDVVAHPDARVRFEREARAVAALSHPNILAIHDFGEANGMVYAVMELLAGETLRDALTHGALPARRATAYAIQMAHGLAAAHDKGIVHRDLKPENVFITPDERVKILDFGLARLELPSMGEAQHTGAPTQSPTQPGVVLGTVGYMAPEQVRGIVVDSRADLFSFGAILYEMVMGARAFQRETTAETMTAILREDPPELTPDRVAPAIDRIVRHCLEKKPEARFRSAHDLAFALQAIAVPTSTAASTAHMPTTSVRGQMRGKAALMAALAVMAALVIGIVVGRRLGNNGAASETLEPPTFRQLTFSRSPVPVARFTPDGQTVIYSSVSDGADPRLFLTRLETPGFTPLAMPSATLFSISPAAELAIGLKPQGGTRTEMTLAQAPLFGGAPRSILEGVRFADWSPTGSGLAIVRLAGSHQRLEFPPGKVLYETEGEIGSPRVSPAGDRVAFLDWPVKDDDRGSVAVVDLAGARRTISSSWEGVSGLSWTPDGREVWYSAAKVGARYSLMGTTLDGRERTIFRGPTGVIIRDIAKDGRALLASNDRRAAVSTWRAGETAERDVTWLDFSYARDISRDGQQLLMTYNGEGSSPSYDVYVRALSGGDATRIGEGQAQEFSPDGRLVLSVIHGPPSRVELLPIGPGESRVVDTGSVTVTDARWLPDGRRLLIAGTEPGKGVRAYLTDTSGAAPRAITPAGVTFANSALALSRDGAQVALRSPEGRVMLYPVAGGEPVGVKGLGANEMPLSWTADSRALFLLEGQPPRRIVRLDPASGRRELASEIHPADAGLIGPTHVVIAPDARTFVANYMRVQGTLYLVQGLK